MKLIFIAIFIFLLFGCYENQHKQSRNEFTITHCFPSESEWGKFKANIPKDILDTLIRNVNDTSYWHVVQLYESTGNMNPEIHNLIAFKFNRDDSTVVYQYQTSRINLNGKSILPNRQERIFWSNIFFNLIDTIKARIEESGFWNQPSEIPVRGTDGKYYCILIKEGTRFHYVLRWSPYGVSDSIYPKRKEFMKLCDLFKNSGKFGLYSNYWNWYGQKDPL
jgi:hypothetical protein